MLTYELKIGDTTVCCEVSFNDTFMKECEDMTENEIADRIKNSLVTDLMIKAEGAKEMLGAALFEYCKKKHGDDWVSTQEEVDADYDEFVQNEVILTPIL